MKGSFVVIDGGEGTGTTTMSKCAVEEVVRGGRKASWSREPGGSVFAETIREVILNPRARHADAETMFALFWAARRDHLVKKVKPLLEDGATIICDRFDSSTWAYQIRGQEQPQLAELFVHMREHYVRDMLPDRYIILDASPEVGLARAKGRGGTLTHFDERNIDFHRRVREGFREFAGTYGATVISAEAPEEVVKTMVLEVIEPLL